ncbi:MAG: hypothetical protein UHS47_11740, partial [Oscillospiraceae bacterium]|nr:hypothetical protein [Oscillospiraceae bacterium]
MMNFFEKEMRQMFDDNDIFQDAKFVGKTMLAKLDEDLRIKLQFIASHISGQYDSVQMTIINRTGGVVDKQNFKFSDIIGKCIRPGSRDRKTVLYNFLLYGTLAVVLALPQLMTWTFPQTIGG